jgi:hypothetical protein
METSSIGDTPRNLQLVPHTRFLCGSKRSIVEDRTKVRNKSAMNEIESRLLYAEEQKTPPKVKTVAQESRRRIKSTMQFFPKPSFQVDESTQPAHTKTHNLPEQLRNRPNMRNMLHNMSKHRFRKEDNEFAALFNGKSAHEVHTLFEENIRAGFKEAMCRKLYNYS